MTTYIVRTASNIAYREYLSTVDFLIDVELPDLLSVLWADDDAWHRMPGWHIDDLAANPRRIAARMLAERGEKYWLGRHDADIGSDASGASTYDGMSKIEYIERLICSVSPVAYRVLDEDGVARWVLDEDGVSRTDEWDNRGDAFAAAHRAADLWQRPVWVEWDDLHGGFRLEEVRPAAAVA